LTNLSYAIDFPSGKIWIAEQLESISVRYLNRNAKVAAQKIRESIVDGNTLKFISAMETGETENNKHFRLHDNLWDAPRQQLDRDTFHGFDLEKEDGTEHNAHVDDNAGLFHNNSGGWPPRLH
jgi:hypothetical protein